MNNFNEINKFLEFNLFNIEKPGRYVGGEFNQFQKDWNSAFVRVALAFPDIYDIGFSNLGLAILYNEINSSDGYLAERVFSPWIDMEKAMRDNSIPLFSLESRREISTFDILGISIPYETLYTNVLNLLNLSNIPLFRKDRNDNYPLVVAGGHSTFNPSPMAPFIDVFVIGDGEDIFLQLIEEYHQKKDRKTLLYALDQVEGFYVPEVYNEKSKSKKFVVKHISKRLKEPPAKILVPNIDTTHNRIAIEVMRGCTRGCRFCQAGFITRPVRERPVEEIIKSLENNIKQTGYEEISLLSLSISDYSNIEELVKEIYMKFSGAKINLSLPSMRIESFSNDLMKKIKQRKGNFTLAPESASQEIRNKINKPISNDEFMTTVEDIFDQGWTSIKLYFLIGLPGETLEDMTEIVSLCKEVKSIGKRKIGGRARLNVSINTFIPKPHTPFQWNAMDDIDTIKQKQKILLDGLKKSKIKFSFPFLNSSLLEGWLSRGDESLSNVIYTAWKDGAKFDAWQDKLNFDIWVNSFERMKIDPFKYSHREREIEDELPWDFVHSGVNKEFLKQEYLKSKEQGITSYCRENCHACGIQRIYDLRCSELLQEKLT